MLEALAQHGVLKHGGRSDKRRRDFVQDDDAPHRDDVLEELAAPSLHFQATRSVRALSERGPPQGTRDDVRTRTAEDEETRMLPTRSRMMLRDFEPSAANTEMIRAGVVRAFARVGFNLRGGRLHGRKPVQVSGASARHTLLSPGGEPLGVSHAR